MLSAALTGTVLFSTTIFLPWPSSTVSAIILAASSTNFRSAWTGLEGHEMKISCDWGTHRLALAEAEGLSWGVNADEDEVGLLDGQVDIGGEVKIAPATFLYNLTTIHIAAHCSSLPKQYSADC